jgi:hypothetical protein
MENVISREGERFVGSVKQQNNNNIEMFFFSLLFRLLTSSRPKEILQESPYVCVSMYVCN